MWGNTFGNQFLYQYDKLNRLTSGISTGIVMSEVMSYDVMGNIKSLTRDGAPGTYNYSGNRLTNVPGRTGSYAYDSNGNAITDGRNGLDITYNMLNLPQMITDPNNNNDPSIFYGYDGTGKKLQKNNVLMEDVTDYVDGIQYKYSASVIDFIQNEEGQAKNNGSGVYSYQYNLKDHLGNVRYSFDIYNGAVRDLQLTDY